MTAFSSFLSRTGEARHGAGSASSPQTRICRNAKQTRRRTIGRLFLALFFVMGICFGGQEAAFARTGIVLNVNDSLTADATLQLGQNAEVVTVTSDALHAETSSTQLGEVIENQEMTAVPLNGRSYTDLLALQPGVANANSGIGGGSSSQNTFQSGGFQLPAVSGDSNASNQSVNGMRESANGYLLNGISVQEFAFSGAAVVPNLESLAEFRIITNNFDASTAG